MGGDCRTWIPHMQFGWQSPYSSSFGAPLDVGKQNGVSAVMNPGINLVSRNETMPAYVSSALPYLQLGQSNEPHGWFYCLPRFPQGLTLAPNFPAEVKLPTDHVNSFRDKTVPCGELDSPQKHFLVIDKTGGRTAIVYGSRFASPNECFAYSHSNLHGACYFDGNEPALRRDVDHMTVPTLVADKVDENQGTGIESEMHEDTEEINALLYSDSDYYSKSNEDDDEVTSTGHSPSTMTTQDNQEILKETAEEVASSGRKAKKQKIWDGYYDDIQLMDTASSLNQNKSVTWGNDAESRCSSGKGKRLSEMGSLSSNKKMRKEKIRDLLSILQSVIPGGKDKDPIMLLEGAIHCLKSLKHKAEVLGLDAL